jgi:hypothetical protein
MKPFEVRVDPLDDHARARLATLTVAVRDAANNRLDEHEIVEACKAARIARDAFDELVAQERVNLAVLRDRREQEAELRRRRTASNRPLNPMEGLTR